jgi:predicted kinase
LSAVDMPRLIHLNGAPGIGKSTLAARYGDEHRGVLRCDIDALRTMIGGWEQEEQAASRARTIALAMITAYLRTGGDVVLPQLVARRDQLERFRRAAEDGGGEHVHIMLLASPAATIQRFRALQRSMTRMRGSLQPSVARRWANKVRIEGAAEVRDRSEG